MPKQGLGRNLGSLMGGKPKEGEAPASAPISAGVGSLMRGNSSTNTASPAPVPVPISLPVSPPKPVIPRWYLFAGDVLLVSLALVTVYKSPHPLSWQRETFCAALVFLAAVLAVIALISPDGKKEAEGKRE